MSLKAQLEALIYAAEEPITLDQLAALLKDDLLALKNHPVEPDLFQPAPEPSEATAPMEAGESKLSEPENAEAHPGAVESQASASGKQKPEKTEKAELRAFLKPVLEELMAEYAAGSRGMEIRQVAGGYRMSTKPEHHDLIRVYAKSLKPPVRLSLQALETLAVIAYKQPVTVPEISEIRGVDASGVIGTLIERKLITTAGRKTVVGRPMLYKTTKDFLLRFGLNDLQELPSVEEFEKLINAEEAQDVFAANSAAVADATGVPEIPEDNGVEQMAEDKAEAPENVTEPAVSTDPHHDRTDEEAAGQIGSE